MQENKGNIFSGIAGALIGGLIAAIPWIVAYVFLNLISSLAAILIASGAYAGYKKLNGPVNKSTIWIIGFITLIVVSVANFVIIPLVYLAKDGFALNMTYYKWFFSSDELILGMIKDYVVSIIFAFIGIQSVVRNIRNDRGIEAEVVYAGENNEQIMIRTVDAIENDERSALIADLQQEFGFDDSDILAQELFGPTVGKELRNNAIKAVLLAAVGMLIYIRLRFKEWNFGASAILGVLHDVLIVLTFYAVFNVTVNNPFIAGILTVVGYSINDTIVIFDRIRENNQLMRKDEEEIIDISINQTLSRSIMTTFTTLIVMVPMFIMTSASMREFILPLMVGVAAGCLSSIFICSPLYYQFSQHKRKTRYQKTLEEGKKKKKKKYIGGTGNKE